jgi:multisubunit Na+/H+ antiporter MnhB subunit
MHWQEKLSAKRWNERIRLIITFMNVTAIGTFGLAVTAPILRSLGGPSGSVFERKVLGINSEANVHNVALFDVIAWEMASAALFLHILAHVLVSLIERED